MIEARSLTKTFRDKKRGEIHAAENVSFRVASLFWAWAISAPWLESQ